MKNKVVSLCLIFMLIITIFSLTGCGNKEEQTDENNTVVESQEVSVQDRYIEFILNKEYEKDIKDLFKTAEEYAIIDINKDGIEELFIQDDYSNEFHNILIYTFDKTNNQVKLVDLIYAYMGIRCNPEVGEIMYTSVKPYGGILGYTFYKLENGSLLSTKIVGQNVDEYFITKTDGKKESITEEERDKYYDGFDYIKYTKISTLQANNNKENTNTVPDSLASVDGEFKAGDYTLRCGTYLSSIGMNDKLGGAYIIKPDNTYVHRYLKDSKTIEEEGTFKIYYFENEPGTLIESLEGWTIQFTPNNSNGSIGTFNITKDNHFEAEQYANYFDLQ